MDMARHRLVRGVRRSGGLMTVGGALAAVYGALLGTPVTAAFYKSIGAKGYHFGLITGIPMLMLSMHFVAALDGWSFEAFGRTWINYHVLFGVSVCLRILCNVWVRTIREPGSSHPIHVLRNLLPVRPWGWVRPPAVTDEDVVEDSFGAEATDND